MKLNEFKKVSDSYTSKASDITRQLSLAGIAIIWIFHATESGKIKLDSFLVYPLILLVLTLSADLLQYVIGGKIWMTFFRIKEKEVLKNNSENLINIGDEDIKAPRSLNKPIYFFYYTKIICMLIAFFLIVIYLIRSLTITN